MAKQPIHIKDCSTSKWTSICSGIAMLVILATMVTLGECLDECETLATDVIISKEKVYEYNGRRTRLTCIAEVTTKKCEGSCVSQVIPSIVEFPGFNRDCKCCKEISLEDRYITLDQCYDGATLVSGQVSSAYIKEPTSCACQSCAVDLK